MIHHFYPTTREFMADKHEEMLWVTMWQPACYSHNQCYESAIIVLHYFIKWTYYTRQATAAASVWDKWLAYGGCSRSNMSDKAHSTQWHVQTLTHRTVTC